MQMGKEIVQVNLADIIPNRFQPRLTFDEEALNELATSIKEHGIIQPLVLRKVGNKYEVIAGERRYKASIIAGLTIVPAIIVDLDDESSAEIALVENIQRKELTPIEEARSYKKLMDLGQTTQEQLAKRMGKSQSSIANKIRLLTLDEEVQNALLKGMISERHARSLLSLKINTEQKDMLKKIIENRLTVKQTDDMIKEMISKTPVVNQPSINPSAVTPSSLKPSETQASMESQPEQGKNIDVVNIANLGAPTTSEQILPNSNSVQSALSDLDIVSTNSDIFNDKEALITDKNEQTQIIDIDKIKAAAEDINKPHEIPNFDQLLKSETGDKKMNQENQVTPEPKSMFGGKFFPSLEEETANMDLGKEVVTNTENNNFPRFDNLINQGPNSNLTNSEQPQSIPETPNAVPAANISPQMTAHASPTSNVASKITTVRNHIQALKQQGINIETEELDLLNEYQIIIKINK